MRERSSKWRHLSNDWLVRILGGVAAAVASAYVIVLIGVGTKDGSKRLPAQSTAPVLKLNVAPTIIEGPSSQLVYLSLSPIRANLWAGFSAYTPTGDQIFGASTRADREGVAHATFQWPVTDPPFEEGLIKIVATDDTTGASAIGYVVVARPDDRPRRETR